jgi:AcrR family transcriptional regulator
MARPRTTTPSIPDDVRTQRSIEALKSALLELIEQRHLDQISIRDITKEAGLSYPTFFRRFESKEELLALIATGEVRHLLALGVEAMARKKRSNEAPLEMFVYVQRHRKLWKSLLTGGARSAMREEFTRIAREIASARPRTNPWIPLDLAVAFVASGLFEILSWWMEQPQSYPVQNVGKLFNALIFDSAGRPRDIRLVSSPKGKARASR